MREIHDQLAAAKAAGLLREIDYRFALFLDRLAESRSPVLLLAAALVSRAAGQGHLCLPLDTVSDIPLFPELEGDGPRLPTTASLRRELMVTGVVGVPGEIAPLILDGENRLYLHRFLSYEELIASDLRQRGREIIGIDIPRARRMLARIFPHDHGNRHHGDNQQMMAAAAALCKRLLIISGGPGTGKTYTVARILALLQDQAGCSLRIGLAAPTGKAAARLTQSIRLARQTLACDAEVAEAIPDNASTLHRLLGTIPGSSRFRHSQDNPLPLDLLVVDEASMIDVPLMARLLAALPAQCRLLLLGDRDQLASVEAGSLFADLCAHGREGWSPTLARLLAELTGHLPPILEHVPLFNDCLVLLTRSYRFHARSGIGALAAAVNRGDVRKLHGIMASGFEDLDFCAPEREELHGMVAQRAIPGYEACFTAPGPAEALATFEQLRILCALRDGPYGVAGINRMVEEGLHRKGLLRRGDLWYQGRPLLITVNNYALQLFNGDIGIIWPDDQGQPRAWFPSPDGGLRSLSPARLPGHETAWAMTVHKSQGSEFDRVILVLPTDDSDILSAELVYTGLTRAKKSLEIWANPDLLSTVIQRRVKRHSGLAARLWQDGVSPGGNRH